MSHTNSPSNLYPTTTWRLLPFLEASGSVQMAIDAWLFQQQELGQQPPMLRFYTWSPPALSLGRLQKQLPERWYDLSSQGRPLALVRRPTGGRAVLHQGDLTYAIALPLDKNVNHWRLYQDTCQFLRSGWQQLGVNLTYGSAKRGYVHNPSCFSSKTAADLLRPDGSKFIGSAQFRGQNTLLQQGTMLLSPDQALFEQIFEETAPWSQPFCPAEQQSHWIPQIIAKLSESARQCFQIQLRLQPLSDEEWQQILSTEPQYYHRRLLAKR